MSSSNFNPKKDPQTSLRTCPTPCHPPTKIWIVCSFAFCLITSWITDLQVEVSFFACLSSCLRNECFVADPPGEGGGGTPGNSWWWCAARFFILQILTLFDLFRPKNVIFHSCFQTRPLKSTPVFTTSSPGRFSLALEVGREKALALDGHMTIQHPEFVGVINKHTIAFDAINKTSKMAGRPEFLSALRRVGFSLSNGNFSSSS